MVILVIPFLVQRDDSMLGSGNISTSFPEEASSGILSRTIRHEFHRERRFVSD